MPGVYSECKTCGNATPGDAIVWCTVCKQAWCKVCGLGPYSGPLYKELLFKKEEIFWLDGNKHRFEEVARIR